ncbi:unnamed protein product [Ambrosiozyma monospora]|uniref:Unnamed protein product n=1 Tax=Ambrosiozyma monospora TaxID=43982 RepID=A0ACB5TVM5_AMBMO|nr:unnamed protein product [Ambrosiozyma monospora]
MIFKNKNSGDQKGTKNSSNDNIIHSTPTGPVPQIVLNSPTSPDSPSVVRRPTVRFTNNNNEDKNDSDAEIIQNPLGRESSNASPSSSNRLKNSSSPSPEHKESYTKRRSILIPTLLAHDKSSDSYDSVGSPITWNRPFFTESPKTATHKSKRAVPQLSLDIPDKTTGGKLTPLSPLDAHFDLPGDEDDVEKDIMDGLTAALGDNEMGAWMPLGSGNLSRQNAIVKHEHRKAQVLASVSPSKSTKSNNNDTHEPFSARPSFNIERDSYNEDIELESIAPSI